MKVSFSDIEDAQKKISDKILKTPMNQSSSASRLAGSDVFFKYENEQKTGSFKIRGALNKILSLSNEEKSKGVIAASAGNHAQGVAMAATMSGVKSTIVMPKTASIVKQMATMGYGANLILHGEIFDEAYAYARELEKEKAYVFIHPYEDPHVIAGQGTLGIEVFNEISDFDSAIVAIGGGGLASGVGLALKTLNPKIKIYGAVAENAPGMKSLFYGEKLPEQITPSIADGISVKKPSSIMYESFLKSYVDEIVTISENEISEAIVFLLERAKTVVEGSGAICWAAAAKGGLNLGRKTCVFLCGGNIDLNLVSRIIDRGLHHSGRLCRLTVIVPDRPGALSRLTQVVAQCGANILEVYHNRIGKELHIRETSIAFLLETKSESHIEEVKKAVAETGALIKE